MASDPWGRSAHGAPSGDASGREVRVAATVIKVTSSRDRDGRTIASLYLKNPAFGLVVASSPHGPQAPFRASERWVDGVCQALDVPALDDLDGLTITVILGARGDGHHSVVGVAGVNGTYRFAGALERH
jgi:hypothetical protein